VLRPPLRLNVRPPRRYAVGFLNLGRACPRAIFTRAPCCNAPAGRLSVPCQLPRDERIADASQIGRTVDADLDHRTCNQELYPAAENRPRSRPSQDRDTNSERCVDPASIAPVPGIDEIETLRTRSPSREAHSFTWSQSGEGRGVIGKSFGPVILQAYLTRDV
jgi:hypothetical protein